MTQRAPPSRCTASSLRSCRAAAARRARRQRELFPPLRCADSSHGLQVADAARRGPARRRYRGTRAPLARAAARLAEHVHRRGVVHCDVKSDNAMATPVAAAATRAPSRARAQARRLWARGTARSSARAPRLVRRACCPATPVWASPEALRLQRASRADPILARDHDLWSFALVALLFVGREPDGEERASRPARACAGCGRPSTSARCTRATCGSGRARRCASGRAKNTSHKIAAKFEEQGVDGKLLRYAGDAHSEGRKVALVAITLGSEMDRTVRRWPRPIPRTSSRCSAKDGRIVESASDRRARTARARRAPPPSWRAGTTGRTTARHPRTAARASRALSAATTIALDDDEQADYHRDRGRAPRAALAARRRPSLSRRRAPNLRKRPLRYDDSRELHLH